MISSPSAGWKARIVNPDSGIAGRVLSPEPQQEADQQNVEEGLRKDERFTGTLGQPTRPGHGAVYAGGEEPLLAELKPSMRASNHDPGRGRHGGDVGILWGTAEIVNLSTALSAIQHCDCSELAGSKSG